MRKPAGEDRRSSVAAKLALLLAVLVAAQASAASAGTAHTHRYDNPGSWTPSSRTPDIEAVYVTRDSAQRTLTFRAVFAKPVPPRPDIGFQVSINADRRSRTGETNDGAGGYDYMLDYSRVSAGEKPYASLETWLAGGWQESTPASLRFTSTANGFTFRVSEAAFESLGDSFDFYVCASSAWPGDHAEVACVPSHALLSSFSAPWTYPPGSARDWFGYAFLGASGAAVLAVLGYAVVRRLRRTPAPAPAAAAGVPPPASAIRRALAFAVDNAVLVTPLAVANAVVGDASANQRLIVAVVFACLLGAPLYFALFDRTGRGQSPGKRLLGISVRDAKTLGRVNLGQAFGREFFRLLMLILFYVPFVLDHLWALTNASRETWHDRAAGTVVVREPARAAPVPSRPARPAAGAV